MAWIDLSRRATFPEKFLNSSTEMRTVARQSHALQRFMFMLGLIIAGEAVFMLPFHITRFFRATFLEVFQFTNTELGAAQACYGVLAMIAYLLGGPIADRFSAKKLLASSLVMTAMGGFYLATFPSYTGARIVWGYWGVTTILLFWAALIRATRDWGGSDTQGRSYGLLDGGRGVLAAGLASLAVIAFAIMLPEDVNASSFDQKKEAMRNIIYGYSFATLVAAVYVWFFVNTPEPNTVDDPGEPPLKTKTLVHHVGRVVRIPSVWLQALIVVCAYVGYKGFDNYSLFAVEGYGLDEVSAARVTALASWMRPIAALAAGMLGDRFRCSRMVTLSFAILLASDLFFALGTPVPNTAWILISNTALACVAIFGLRGLYFALFQEAKVPMAVTGAAVGLVSMLGYTPDIFVTLVGGILLDRSPGLAGHQQFFWFLAGFAALGVLASIAFEWLNSGPDAQLSDAVDAKDAERLAG